MKSYKSLREASSVAVVPRRYAPMGVGSIPSPGAVCAFGFQTMIASAGFSQVPLHLKLEFLRGYCTSYPKLACFVLYLKIINTGNDKGFL